MSFRLSIAQRLWAPTAFLALALVLAGSVTTVRTQGLIRSAAAEQSAQLDKLVLALQWRGAVASGDAPAAARVAESLRAHAADADERRALDAAAADGAQRLPALDALVTLQRSRLEALQAQAAEQRMRTVWGVLGLLALIIVASGAGATYLVRTVRRPLHQLGQVAERIGHGDLAAELDTSRRDEIGDLQRSVAGMRDALRRLVADMQRSAEQIRHASAEVAAGNMDLSARTETAAARLQQTAASMAHITQRVDESAQAAGEARRLAGDAAEVARRGGEAVGRVVSTMQGISESSRRIADITGVIDGIAFQTNILALNAAVEAARAGEQGRGFAVVAGEVRALAQRCASAAREIKALIGSSTAGIEQGATLAGDAGRTMDEIVAGVVRVSSIVERITDGGAEQVRGVAEVDAAIGELDGMTQQNAALVEQSAAAAQSLNDQAQRLAQAVQTFRLAPA